MGQDPENSGIGFHRGRRMSKEGAGMARAYGQRMEGGKEKCSKDGTVNVKYG